MDRNVEVRDVVSAEDFEAWRRVRLAVDPHGRAPQVEALRRAATGGQTFLLAFLDGVVAGSGVTGRSDLPDAAFVAPRVPAGYRRQGVGSALLAGLAPHAAAMGLSIISADVDDPGSLSFAERFGFHEVDRQVEQVRVVAVEAAANVPVGVEIVSVAERPELWRLAYRDIAQQAFEDMANIVTMEATLQQWEQDWISDPSATFLALADGRVIGCAGLLPDADRRGVAENGLTAVSRDWRGRGVALALKQTTFMWAAQNGIREIYTWTQRGNADMRKLNERLGYRTRTESISVRAAASQVLTRLQRRGRTGV